MQLCGIILITHKYESCGDSSQLNDMISRYHENTREQRIEVYPYIAIANAVGEVT